jgi:hypothetical protein
MNRIVTGTVFSLVVSLLAFGALAQTSPSCRAQAGEKKLAGAAFNSFMTRCERDAKSSCDAFAMDRKLAGAAKTSFTKKCVDDQIGK